MYICGELKQRELLLCCIPRPIFACLNYMFGKRYYNCTGTNCRRCTAVLSVFLIPVAFTLGAFALTACIVSLAIYRPILTCNLSPELRSL